MDNAMVVAGHGRALSRRLLVRLSLAAMALSFVVATVLAVFQRGAEAQFNPFAQIVCPILLAVLNTIGGLFGGIFGSVIQSLLAAFGCTISG
jgi:hypothetical protein